MVRSVAEKEVLDVTVHPRERAFRQFNAGGCTPEVDAIVARSIKVTDGVFETMEVYLSWGRIGLGELHASVG
jgi:hypothetical protein